MKVILDNDQLRMLINLVKYQKGNISEQLYKNPTAYLREKFVTLENIEKALLKAKK